MIHFLENINIPWVFIRNFCNFRNSYSYLLFYLVISFFQIVTQRGTIKWKKDYIKNNENVTCLRIIRKKIDTYEKLTKNLRNLKLN
jgi:hypothetical protein